MVKRDITEKIVVADVRAVVEKVSDTDEWTLRITRVTGERSRLIGEVISTSEIAGVEIYPYNNVIKIVININNTTFKIYT